MSWLFIGRSFPQRSLWAEVSMGGFGPFRAALPCRANSKPIKVNFWGLGYVGCHSWHPLVQWLMTQRFVYHWRGPVYWIQGLSNQTCGYGHTRHAGYEAVHESCVLWLLLVGIKSEWYRLLHGPYLAQPGPSWLFQSMAIHTDGGLGDDQHLASFQPIFVYLVLACTGVIAMACH